MKTSKADAAFVQMILNAATESGGVVETRLKMDYEAADIFGPRSTFYHKTVKQEFWRPAGGDLLGARDWNVENCERAMLGVNPRVPVTPRLVSRRRSTGFTKSKILAVGFTRLDIDAIRPPKMATTFKEHDDAIDAADTLRLELKRRGYGEGWLLDTGNSASLIYRHPLVFGEAIPLLAAQTREWQRRIAKKYNSDRVRIDLQAVHAQVLIGIPGTWNRAHATTEDRPHRRVQVLVEGDVEPNQRLLDKINTMPAQHPGTYTRRLDLEVAPCDPNRLINCNLIRFIVERAQATGHMTHRERMAIGSIGRSLGGPGQQWVHQVMSLCDGYSEFTTARMLRSITPTPYRCKTSHRRLVEIYGKDAPPRCPGCTGEKAVPTSIARYREQP